MKVFSMEATVLCRCKCGATLSVEPGDIGENMHDGGYGVSCPVCGHYVAIEYATLPDMFKRVLGKMETGH